MNARLRAPRRAPPENPAQASQVFSGRTECRYPWDDSSHTTCVGAVMCSTPYSSNSEDNRMQVSITLKHHSTQKRELPPQPDCMQPTSNVEEVRYSNLAQGHAKCGAKSVHSLFPISKRRGPCLEVRKLRLECKLLSAFKHAAHPFWGLPHIRQKRRHLAFCLLLKSSSFGACSNALVILYQYTPALGRARSQKPRS